MRLSLPSPTYPWLRSVALTVSEEVEGATENHSIPACLLELMESAVSSAPQSAPFTHITCCIRVSLLSRLADFSANGSLIPSRTSEQELLLRHSRSGWFPDFCVAEGGGA